jgi:hypothetical protein
MQAHGLLCVSGEPGLDDGAFSGSQNQSTALGMISCMSKARRLAPIAEKLVLAGRDVQRFTTGWRLGAGILEA